MSEKTILIVDDETPILRSMSICLELEGYTVLISENGEDALKVIEQADSSHRKIDLLITDLQMPKMSGFILIDRLEELKLSLPILVMTGFGTKEIVIDLLRKGIKEYIDKPFESDELVKRVERLLEKIKNQPAVSKNEPSLSKPNHIITRSQNNVFIIEFISQYQEASQNDLRNIFLEALQQKQQKVQLDFKGIDEVDITLLNALLSFGEKHKEQFDKGCLEIINVVKDVYFLFAATDVDKIFQIKERG